MAFVVFCMDFTFKMQILQRIARENKSNTLKFKSNKLYPICYQLGSSFSREYGVLFNSWNKYEYHFKDL